MIYIFFESYYFIEKMYLSENPKLLLFNTTSTIVPFLIFGYMLWVLSVASTIFSLRVA